MLDMTCGMLPIFTQHKRNGNPKGKEQVTIFTWAACNPSSIRAGWFTVHRKQNPVGLRGVSNRDRYFAYHKFKCFFNHKYSDNLIKDEKLCKGLE